MSQLLTVFYQKALAFVSNLCEGIQTKTLAALQTELSQTYRQHSSTHSLKNPLLMAIYGAVRMPATYHAVKAVLANLPSDFRPQTLLDLGAGPGTASLAALDYWPSALQQIDLVENQRQMYAFQQKLWASLKEDLKSCVVKSHFQSLTALSSNPADLTIISYALGELDQTHREDALNQAWRLTTRYLVIITPGTCYDFEYLLKAREFLIQQGAHIIAPCPHS